MTTMADSRAETKPARSEAAGDVAALQSEVELLRAKLQERPPARHSGFWRSVVVVICLVAVTVLSPLCIMSAWAHREIASTDTYVSTVAPLASDPAVQAAVSERVSDEVITLLDVPALTNRTIAALEQRGAGPRVTEALNAFRTPLQGAIESFIRTQVKQFVASQTFADAWAAANREAHTQLVAVLTGNTASSAVEVTGQTVSVNLATVIEAVKAELVARGFAIANRIPEVNASFVLLQSADLGKAQSAFRLLEHLTIALPVIVVALGVAAVVVSRQRRKTAIAALLCVAGGMILLGLLIAVFRAVYLDAITNSQLPRDAAAAAYDTLVRFIRSNLRGVLLVAMIAAAAVWVTGPTPAAQGIRRGASSAVSRARTVRSRGFAAGPVAAWLWKYGGVIRATIVAGCALALVWIHPITGLEVIVVAAIAGLVWLISEILAAPPDPAATERGSVDRASPASGQRA
jgi:hypothetical protein